MSALECQTSSASRGSQRMHTYVNGELFHLELPDPNELLSIGVPWGEFDALFTPAFWRGQAWQHHIQGHYLDNKLGRTLQEEMAACLLGGFGMPAAMGLAAFDRLRHFGLLKSDVEETHILDALLEPLVINGRLQRYRFPRQKAQHLASALQQLEGIQRPDDDVALRDSLTSLPGIGLKTASWIVRNHRGSNAVAIIDIHILRAGRLAGIFPEAIEPASGYRTLEKLFLDFAYDLMVPASSLDALIWDYMRRLPLHLVT
jgi:thermostable 8-oxoguanine DNA glycosylase